MRVGTIVRNTIPMRINPAVHSPEEEIPAGTIGIVIAVRQWSLSHDTYVDVLMGVHGRCGNYHAGTFTVAV